MGAAFLKPQDIMERWTVSKATVYRAIDEMEQGGYLKRLYIGKGHDQRIALESIETYERLHNMPGGGVAAEVVALRVTGRKKKPSPPVRKDGPSLREFVKGLRSRPGRSPARPREP